MATTLPSASESLLRAFVNAGSVASVSALRCPRNVRIAASSRAALLMALAHHTIVKTSPRTMASLKALSLMWLGSALSRALPSPARAPK